MFDFAEKIKPDTEPNTLITEAPYACFCNPINRRNMFKTHFVIRNKNNETSTKARIKLQTLCL